MHYTRTLYSLFTSSAFNRIVGIHKHELHKPRGQGFNAIIKKSVSLQTIDRLIIMI